MKMQFYFIHFGFIYDYMDDRSLARGAGTPRSRIHTAIYPPTHRWSPRRRPCRPHNVTEVTL